MNRIKTYIIGILLLICTPSQAQMKWNQTYQTYINQYKDLAIEQMLRYRIPASITLAQGLFESAAGKSVLVLDKVTTILASNATTGLVQPNTTMTMPEANVSEYIKMPGIAMRIIANFWPNTALCPPVRT